MAAKLRIGDHASVDDPQHDIRSEKTDHLAAHKGSALTKLNE